LLKRFASYVFYLETRVEQLETILRSNNIEFPSAGNLELCSRPGVDPPGLRAVPDGGYSVQSEGTHSHSSDRATDSVAELPKRQEPGQVPGMPNVLAPSKPRSLASASGVSFARVVFAAVQYSVTGQNGSAEKPIGGRAVPTGNGTSMRDSFFGLHTKPTIQPAVFPTKEVANRLVRLYFEHANPQIPILHRVEFMRMFDSAYAAQGQVRGPRELYMLNMVFAIGCGVIVGEPIKAENREDGRGGSKGPGKATQAQPEEYHASAIVHLEACLSNSGGGLEVLQAVLLLANFALLRPVPPGLW
jgi:hypothetical protein